jgi:hypothetical protein
MLIEATGIDHVQLCVPPGTLEQAKDFYLRVLELDVVEVPEPLQPYRLFWCGRGPVVLHISEDAEIGRTRQHPALIVKRLSEVRSTLEKRGIRTFDEPKLPDRERFSFFDPFQNKIELLEFE